jgi:DUF1680 family protein
VPGRQEISRIGLVKLFLVTGEERYLTLAKFFLGEPPAGPTAMNSTVPTHRITCRSCRTADVIGHAVPLLATCILRWPTSPRADWPTVLHRRHRPHLGGCCQRQDSRLTGGIGARHEGEAFGEAYELPNRTAYNETCAAIAKCFLESTPLPAARPRQVHRRARTLLVQRLSLPGSTSSGDRFFDVNPLEFDGTYSFNRERFP